MQRIKRIWNKLIATKWIFNSAAKASFSQVGEDKIIAYFFNSIGVKHPSYLEIGTNHPVIGNNTYAFYLTGSKGVLIEPDPSLHSIILSKRKHDKLLTCGIALNEAQNAPFFIFPKKYSGWNTFSTEEVEVRKKMGINVETQIFVPLSNINDILKNHFTSTPDFISIDVEGLDEEIIRSLNFERYKPTLLCIETIKNGDSVQVAKQHSLIDFVCSKGYRVYADTFVNTLFVKNELIN